jgi:hypothetical protein
MRSPLVLAASLLALAACAPGRRPASSSPVGAPARYGDRTADGVVLLLRAPLADVRAAVVRALAANGHAVDPEAADDRTVRSAVRRLGGDTSLVVRAELTPEDPSGGGVVVVFSGAYDAPAVGVRRARVVQRPGERSPLYAHLRALADSTRRFVASRADGAR